MKKLTKTKKNILIVILLLFICAVVFFLFNIFGINPFNLISGDNKSKDPNDPKNILGDYFLNYTVKRSDVGDYLEIIATTDADVYKIVSKVNDTIQKIYVAEGQYVKKGQILMKIDDKQVRSKYLAAYIEYANSDSAGEKIKEQKKIDMDIAKANLDNAIIKSPVDGIIKEILFKEGETTGSNTNVMNIIDRNSIVVTGTIDEVDLKSVSVGKNAIITFDHISKPFDAKVSYISPSADNVNGVVSIPIKIKFNQDPSESGVIPGLTCNAKVVIMTMPNALAIPTEAVLNDENGQYVYVAAPKNPDNQNSKNNSNTATNTVTKNNTINNNVDMGLTENESVKDLLKKLEKASADNDNESMRAIRRQILTLYRNGNLSQEDQQAITEFRDKNPQLLSMRQNNVDQSVVNTRRNNTDTQNQTGNNQTNENRNVDNVQKNNLNVNNLQGNNNTSGNTGTGYRNASSQNNNNRFSKGTQNATMSSKKSKMDLNNYNIVKKYITIGQKTDTMAEIISGLKEGDIVLIKQNKSIPSPTGLENRISGNQQQPGFSQQPAQQNFRLPNTSSGGNNRNTGNTGNKGN